MRTVDHTDYLDTTYLTIAELNALFTAIAVVVDGKLDIRGDTLHATIVAAAGGVSILNVPAPVATGDLLRPGD